MSFCYAETHGYRQFCELVLRTSSGSSRSERQVGIMSADAMLRSLNDTDWRWIEQGKIFGDECDRITGLNNAKREGKQEDARNMLAIHLGTHEQIAQVTGLPLKDIEKMAAELEVQRT